MRDLLYNPVYAALVSGDRNLALQTATARYFDEAVSPFVGFPDDNATGFDELFDAMPRGRLVLYANPRSLPPPRGWTILQKVKGVQMVHSGDVEPLTTTAKLTPLNQEHVEQMVQLAQLTRPGPFGPRTIEFGHYFGVIDKGQLLAMTGQRLHVGQFTEISAVCTHPDHLGRGYASALLQHQVRLIFEQGKTPFLHVRAITNGRLTSTSGLAFASAGTCISRSCNDANAGS